jgi:hypothetical protein
MSKRRHTEAEMIGALKLLEAGREAEDVAREVGYRSTPEREARDSVAIPCLSRSPIPAQTGEGAAETCRILT